MHTKLHQSTARQTSWLYLILTLLISLPTLLNAQEVENPKQHFTQTTWYLYKLVIDDTIYPFVPNQVVENTTLEISQYASDYEAYIQLCSDYYFTINFDDDNDFYCTNAVSFDYDYCADHWDQEIHDQLRGLDFLYIDDFWGFTQAQLNFSYTVITNNDYNNNYELIITNSLGNQAYYGDVPLLSTKKNESIKPTLYPNPAQTSIYIDNIDAVITIHILSLNGKKLITKDVSTPNQKIDISKLAAGIYLYSIENKNKQIKQLGKLVVE